MANETVDVNDRLVALERRVAKVERLTEVVIATRADVATIAESLDPNLARHVAELEATVENHGLLLGRLLDEQPGDNT
jgi:hypothetical protein